MVAASAGELLDPAQRPALRNLVRISADSVRGRVIVVDGRGRLLADSAGGARRAQLRRPSRRSARALHGHGEQITRNSKTLGAADPRHRGAGARATARRGRGADNPERRRGHSAVKTSILDLAALAGVVLLLGADRGRRRGRRSRSRGRSAASTGRRAGSPAATSMRAVAVEGSTEQRSLARSLQRDDAAGQAAAARPAGLRRRRLAPAAHAADRPAAAARGPGRALRAATAPSRPSWRRRWGRSTGSR